MKDYFSNTARKRSGWEALKSVVKWSGKTFEIQIQTLRNFLRERERLTTESHTSFRANRERLRTQVAGQMPLFSFYRNLLSWLFMSPDTPPPRYENITLKMTD